MACADDVESESGGGGVEARGYAAAVERSVVEDEQAVGAQRLGQHGVGRSLDVVGGYDPREVPLSGGVVAAGFARGGARSGVCQSDRGGRGGDHRERTMGGAVGDRDLDGRAFGEERADDRDHARVVGERPRVGGAASILFGGSARGDERVVAGLVAECEAPGAEVIAPQDEPDRVGHLKRQLAAGALERHV